MRHHLVRWHDRYHDDGLVVIEVNQSIGEPLEVMRSMVESAKLKHPVLWDSDCRNTKAYGVTAWPIAYLIGRDGKVFWEGNPARWLQRENRRVRMRQLLEEKLAQSASPCGECRTSTR